MRSDDSQESTLLHGDAELTEIMYRHMSHENMVSCAETMHVKADADMDPREFTRIFLHQFAERYHGPHNIGSILQSFIKNLDKYPCLSEAVPELKWLKQKRRAEDVALSTQAEVAVSIPFHLIM